MWDVRFSFGVTYCGRSLVRSWLSCGPSVIRGVRRCEVWVRVPVGVLGGVLPLAQFVLHVVFVYFLFESIANCNEFFISEWRLRQSHAC